MPVARGVRDDTARWRRALERMGVDQVRETLRARPNRPLDEAFPDLVPDPPFPTRGFVQDWVVEQENRIVRISKSTVLLIITAIAVVLLGWFATSSFEGALPTPPTTMTPVDQAQQH